MVFVFQAANFSVSKVSIFRCRFIKKHIQITTPSFLILSNITGLPPRPYILYPANAAITPVIAKYLITSVIPIGHIVEPIAILKHGYIPAFTPPSLVAVSPYNRATVTAQHASTLMVISRSVKVHFLQFPLLFRKQTEP